MLPHLPQWLGLVLTFTHAPLQLVRPPGQLLLHCPFAQTRPSAQAFPQPPQWAGSLFGSTHAPLQVAKPATHWAVHVPASQAAMVPAAGEQALPHWPQCAGSVVVSTQAAPQRSLGLHAKSHWPAAHTAVPPPGAVHSA